jgi:hypothetical protein
MNLALLAAWAGLLAANPAHLWYAVPLIAVASLVWGATRYEATRDILAKAGQAGIVSSVSFAAILAILYWLSEGLWWYAAAVIAAAMLVWRATGYKAIRRMLAKAGPVWLLSSLIFAAILAILCLLSAWL